MRESRKTVINVLAAALLAAVVPFPLHALAAGAEPAAGSGVKLLQAEPQQIVACKRVRNFYTGSHLRVIKLDQAFADKVLDRYIDSLDSTRMIFLKSDVESFRKRSADMLSLLDDCSLGFGFGIYNTYTARKLERWNYAISLLDGKFDMSSKESYVFDRSKSEWPADRAEYDRLWRNRVQYELELLMLDGNDEKKAADLLRRRYRNYISFLSQVNDDDAFSAIENAFSAEMDPHTNYMAPKAAEEFNNEMNLKLEGIGATLTVKDEYVTVLKLVPGGPAEKSGQLAVNDRIVAAKDDHGKVTDLVGMRIDMAVTYIRGQKGSHARLQIQRGTGSGSRTFWADIVRDEIRLEDQAAKGSVKTSYDGRKIGVIKIPSFYTNLHSDVKKEIDSLKAQGIEGLVIDLRNNGGGLLTEATLTSGLFFSTGDVVQIADVNHRIESETDIDPSIQYAGPLTVLINRFSASASEIFAAAMADYGRGVIVGENSFGKGTVQQSRALDRIYDLYDRDLGSITFTIGKFYRVNGGSTQNRGVKPDIAFPPKVDPAVVGESELPNALEWDQIRPGNYHDLGMVTPEIVSALSKKHDERAENEQEFVFARKDFVNMQKVAAEKTAPLDFAELKKIRDESEVWELEKANARLKVLGKPAIKKLSDLPLDLEMPDGYLDEAVNITSDLASLEKVDAAGKAYSAAPVGRGDAKKADAAVPAESHKAK